ncbi:MAG: sugar phosphate isomerase/epimerase [Spirochaetaceae bacterium]|nr:MAG: sugar phosphate isomerase/epimerase [Spirochaetaceae bacterium]
MKQHDVPPVRLSAFPKCYLDQISYARTMSVEDWIDEAMGLDCHGLEMYEGFLWYPEDDSYIRGVADRIRAADFRMPMLCCSPDFTNPDPEARRDAVIHQLRMIEVAEMLGGPGVVCRVLSGQRYPELDREQGLQWVVECIEACLPKARELDVVLGIENHYKDGHWKFAEFAQKMDVFLDLLSRIGDHKNFGVQFDPSNAIVAGDDPIELLEKVKHRVVSMHASDRYLEPGHTLDELRQADGTLGYSPFLNHGVVGKGLNDYDGIFSILADAGYRGWVSIEDGVNGFDEMAESLAFLQEKVKQHFLRET